MAAYSTLTDQELTTLLKQGDQHAFRKIYEKYSKKVYYVALRMLGSEESSEEVMQEVMLKLWQKANSLHLDTNLEAYLKTLAKNRSFNELRRQAMEFKAVNMNTLDWTDSHNETEERIILGETQKILEDGIALLPPQQKAVYSLCHQQGLKYEEAAERLNLSPLTIKTHMQLSLRFLRNYISTHTDVAVLAIILGLLQKK
jgi:RNA polymerase sigma-70 factor (family 1)